MRTIPGALLALLVAVLAGSIGSARGEATRESLADKLAVYTYEDSKNLVTLVEEAAGVMEQQGTAAFREFAVPGSRWFDEGRDLFVYTADGTCLFHPAQPALVGRNLIGLEDMDGKPYIRMITDIAARSETDASGWVFYLWADGTQLQPQWMSSYVRKIVAPDHKIYLIGSGVHGLRVEKAFVKTRIKEAARLLQCEGKEAGFARLRDPASPFVFLDTYIFVLDAEGHALVDPQFPNSVGRDIAAFKDAVGFAPVRRLLQRLETADTAWVQYLVVRPDSNVLVRKLIYARKIMVGGEVLIVGSDLYLATPIWMKSEADSRWSGRQA
jgi:signal transduction histidine kinase